MLIPEVPMIVRKIAPNGHHCAYWNASNEYSESACREWHRRLQERTHSEETLAWSTESIHTESQTVLVTFKEQPDVR